MKISVLVPVYKAEQYITRCAESIFSQRYENLEVLFVNDCTPDRSIELLQRLLAEKFPGRQSQVKIINHEKNRGSAAARNTLLDNATGDFVCWVDADDWLEKDAIANLVKKQQEGNYDIVSGWSYEASEEGIRPFRQPVFQSKEDMLSDMWKPYFHHVLWGRIIRRSLYEEHNIRSTEGFDYGEDFYLMVAAVFYSKEIASITDYVYYYNRANTSAQSYQRNSIINKNRWEQSNHNLNITLAFVSKNNLLNSEAGERIIKEKFGYLCMAAKSQDNRFFQIVANEIKADCKDYYYAIGFNNPIYRFVLTNYKIASPCLRLRAFFIKCLERK